MCSKERIKLSGKPPSSNNHLTKVGLEDLRFPPCMTLATFFQIASGLGGYHRRSHPALNNSALQSKLALAAFHLCVQIAYNLVIHSTNVILPPLDPTSVVEVEYSTILPLSSLEIASLSTPASPAPLTTSPPPHPLLSGHLPTWHRSLFDTELLTWLR